MKPKLAALVIFLSIYFSLAAQQITNQGKDFFVTFPWQTGQYLPDVLLVYLTSKVNTTGNITNPNTGYNVPFTLTAGQVLQVQVPTAQASNTTPETINNLGLEVTSADTISVYSLLSESYSSDATTVLPKNALGTNYMVASYSAGRSTALIEATEDNTIVQIVPVGLTTNFTPAAVPIVVKLNKGQTYMFASGYGYAEDQSGSFISVTNGCKPIAVFSGNESGNVPVGYNYADIFYDQLFPTNSFGKQFITATIKGRNVYRARVFAAYNNTVVTIDGVNVGTINAGKYYEFESTNNLPKYISTSNPTEVLEFATSITYDNAHGPTNNGDPTMMNIPPLEQQLKSSVFVSPTTGVISSHKVSIICKTADAPNTFLDGANVGASFTAVVGNPLYSQGAFDINAGQHAIKNNNGFVAYAYGFGYEQGYGYCTGASVENINTYFTCNDVPSLGIPTINACLGDAVFKIVTSGSNAAYSWDFGDGSPLVNTDGSILQQTHNYNAAGDYLVKLVTNVGATIDACNQITSQVIVHVAASFVPSVALVSSPANPICQGTLVSFVATPTNGGANPAYQWQLNGTNVGTNSPVFTSSTLAEGDVVGCTLTSSFSCATVAKVATSLTMHVSASVLPSVTIATPSTTVCTGNLSTTFTATPIAGVVSPAYQWKVNGYNAGTNSPTFVYSPNNGDVVTCVLAIGNACTAANTATSNAITMTVLVGTGVTASVAITAAKNPICANTNGVFTAAPVNGGNTPTYQWKLNGVNVGSNSPTYSNASLKNNDTVVCIMTSNSPCVSTPTVTSNKIVVQVNPVVTPTISIATPQNNICQGDLAVFTATVTNGGNLPVYQWSLNNVNVGSNTSSYSNNNLVDGDVITCTLVSSANCAINPATTNAIAMKVNPIVHPTIVLNASKTAICKGENVLFTVSATNSGNSPTFYWDVNGKSIGNSGSTFNSSDLSNGDVISCKMVSSIPCATESYSQNIAITVFPLPTVVFNPNQTVILYGTSFQLNPVVTGNISSYNWSPSTFLSDPTISSPVSTTTQNETYTLKVSTANDCTASADMKIVVFRDLIMPSAFTPNGDGNNDVFRIPSIYNDVTIHSFTIYDRWGKKIFMTNEITKGWDGSINGQMQANSVYVWMIEYENPITKQTKTINGTVTMIR